MTVSLLCDVDNAAAEPSPCDLSATTVLPFEPLTGATRFSR